MPGLRWPTSPDELCRNGRSSAFRTIIADVDGNNCGILESVPDAYRTCLLATNLNLSRSGGEAYGELNSRRTPAYDVLVWRARANGDAGVYGAGGLEGAFRETCEGAVADPGYLYSAGSFRVRVSVGRAVPSVLPETSP